MMSKKDFISLADRLMAYNIPWEIEDALCDWMKSTNPRFKRERWMNYRRGNVGPNGGVIK